MCENRTCEYIYAKEKIGHAIYVLATREDEIRARLLHATARLHVLNRQKILPQPLEKKWSKIWQQLTRFGISYTISGKEKTGPVEHTMRRIKKKTGRKIAEDIYDFWLYLKEF